jgi:hypothetical protein
MPRLDLVLSGQATAAISLVRAGEIAHVSGGPIIRKEWSVSKLEALHELAYLRVFAAWEAFLEAVFYRSLCGYASTAGQETLVAGFLVTGTHYPSLMAAEAAVLGPRNTFLLWHSPQKVIQRCKQYIRSGTGFPGRQEQVLASNLARLESLAATRHRIVHDNADAKKKFDDATLHIAGRTYLASRPGRFLRDYSALPRKRWLDLTIAELTALAGQIV